MGWNSDQIVPHYPAPSTHAADEEDDMSHTWDPDRYLAYADERGRPFVDLLARVPAENPRVVVDLGCGPGNLTSLLADRWRGASVTGIDSSPEMIAAAS